MIKKWPPQNPNHKHPLEREVERLSRANEALVKALVNLTNAIRPVGRPNEFTLDLIAESFGGDVADKFDEAHAALAEHGGPSCRQN